MKKKLLLHEQ